MILYDYHRSSAAYRVRIGLNLLGLDYTAIPVNLLAGEQRSPDNLARNPQGLVPTMQIDGLTLTQSLAILEYLDDTRGPAFLPANPAARAHCRALAYAIAMDVSPICNLSVRAYAANISNGTVTADDWQRRFITPGLMAFDAMLPAHGTYCHGDSITLPDLVLVPQVYNARRVNIDLTAMPRISAIMAALEEHPAVQAAHPDLLQPRKADP